MKEQLLKELEMHLEGILEVLPEIKHCKKKCELLAEAVKIWFQIIEIKKS